MHKFFMIDEKELEGNFQKLLDRKINSPEDLKKWLVDESKLYDGVKEKLSRNYFATNCYSDNKEIKATYEHDNEVIWPLLKKYGELLDKFFYNSEYRNQLGSYYDNLVKKRANSIEIFRKENIDIEVKEDKLCTKYYDITGNMSVMWNNEEKTLQQMSVYMKDSDREMRKNAWTLVQNRRLKDSKELDEIMDNLVKLRNEKALNADCKDFVEFMFKKLERFSYTPEDCIELQESVLKSVVPIVNEIRDRHKEEIKVEDYRPWDVSAVKEGQKPLKPYNNVNELIDGVLKIFKKKDEIFFNTLNKMKNSETLDLESRKAKSPGGFCDVFRVSNTSCIFMNEAQSQDDLATLTHEGGHSVHNTLTSNIEIADYAEMPSETAELASMSMELICMDSWDVFYKDEEELKRAKREHLEGIIEFLPWGVLVDRFQHWMYSHPEHSAEERNEKFAEMAKQFQFQTVDFSGYEDALKNFWKKQLHIFEVPFYYIEYVMAQLGALQIWRNYKKDPKRAIESYKKALSLGSSVSIPEVYAAAEIKFDFSENMIKELMEFVKSELDKLY
ncbi:M3 family oligoendopeptidase [Clostridium hydrogenum]|uniref:M3 family oligoendopeptidase n=1 Tax=Clostridium hydrogenum TaxID=2855764 RepID=UPI001F1BE5E5|nr:M3 family oligoendopeptidase [Clostridium hydrogenum]